MLSFLYVTGFKTLFILLLGLSTIHLSAQHKSKIIEEFISDPELRYAGIGIYMTDQNNVEVLSHNPDLNLIPASTLKIFTSLAAFEFLSPDFSYQTTLSYTNEIEPDGTLRGDLFLSTSGDPSLVSCYVNGYSLESFCAKIYQILLKNNIKCIDGSLVLQTDLPPRPPLVDTWLWQDVGNYYAGGAHSFNIIDNSYDLRFDVSGAQGSTPSIISIIPEISGLKFDNKLIIGPAHSGDQSYIYGGPKQMHKVIRGSLPQRSKPFKIKGAIPDPADFFINYLSNYFNDKKIIVNNIEARHTDTRIKSQHLYSFTSPKLPELIQVVNEKSVNLYAEAILNTCMTHLNTESAQEVYDSLLLKWDLNPDGNIIKDGSGLSPRNSINTKTISELLSKASKQTWFDDFKESLAEGGQEGTLKHLFKSKKEIKILAKSGSMSSVRGYAGYYYKGDHLAGTFAILVNNYTMSDRLLKQKIERLIFSAIDRSN